MAHEHRWRIATNLPLGLPDADGWVQVLLIRACRTCEYCEVLHGSQSTREDRRRLHAWEAWVAGRMVASGTNMRWKHS